MRAIPPYRLFLGSVVDAWNLRRIHELGIVAVVDLAGNERPFQGTRDLTLLRFPLVDGDGNPDWLLRLAVKAVHDLLTNDVPTFVYCSAGMSRSPTIVAAGVARFSGKPLADCLEQVCREHPADVSPALLTSVRAALELS